MPPVRALSIHADYRCRNNGACCRSGWEIPVEPAVEARIRAGIDEGRLRPAVAWARPLPGLPHGARSVLRVLGSGDCVFLEHGAPRLCAIQRTLGADAMPAACRQFPRVATLTPLGVSLTLSHYCPTAAAMLFRDDVALAVVSDPAAFPDDWPYEGLDARGALPPLLRPGVLMSWDAHARLEEHAVAAFGREDAEVEAALAALEELAETLRGWTPADGPFDDSVRRAIEDARPGAGRSEPLTDALAAWERAAAAIPDGHPRPTSPRAVVEPLGLSRVQPRIDTASSGLRRPVGRWLAARAFASWLTLQGDGVRTSMAGLRLAHSVLRAELARGGEAGEGASLDSDQLLQAIRRADLLLVHLADPVALARELSRCEAEGPAPARRRIS